MLTSAVLFPSAHSFPVRLLSLHLIPHPKEPMDSLCPDVAQLHAQWGPVSRWELLVLHSIAIKNRGLSNSPKPVRGEGLGSCWLFL